MKIANQNSVRYNVGNSNQYEEKRTNDQLQCIRKKRAFRLLIVIFTLFFPSACGHKPEVNRPENVPIDAVFVRGAKVGWWQQCKTTNASQAVYCRIWNGAGLVLENEEFIPHDGGAPPKVGELSIESDPKFPGPDRIFLTNGRILLPRSRFDEMKQFVDWLQGKRQDPL
jgi:hypothetical protein